MERERPSKSKATEEPLIVLVGPTAVGKSDVAVELALRLHGEVVTADSMQVYRGLDIGTTKPTPQQQRGVPHHLIDVCDPDRRFNVAEYRDLAHEAIGVIHERGRRPILAGGTGLYVRAVLDEFLFPDEGADHALRSELEKAAAAKGPEILHRRLHQVDPITARRLHPNDIRRVIRAIEVYETTGRPLSHHLRHASAKEPRYQTAMIGLTRPRESLYQRINDRVDQQIRDGLVDEVKALTARYEELPVAGQALGYKEIMAYLRGDLSLFDAVTLIKRDTRRYAKRQFTWFNRDSRITWFDLERLTPRKQALQHIEQEIKGTLR